MESKDIIKSLECCIKSSHLGECFENKCPLVSEKGCKVGKETLYPYALELIKNQQAFIKKYENIERADDKLIELQQAEIETAKTEAYKEFADKLNDNAVWLENHKVIFKIYVDKTLEELTERKEDK